MIFAFDCSLNLEDIDLNLDLEDILILRMSPSFFRLMLVEFKTDFQSNL